MTLDERVAEFNKKVNKEVYDRGMKSLQSRIDKDYDIQTEADYEEVIDKLLWRAWFNDCFSLTIDEGYYLIAEYQNIDDANQFLEEQEYYGGAA